MLFSTPGLEKTGRKRWPWQSRCIPRSQPLVGTFYAQWSTESHHGSFIMPTCRTGNYAHMKNASCKISEFTILVCASSCENRWVARHRERCKPFNTSIGEVVRQRDWEFNSSLIDTVSLRITWATSEPVLEQNKQNQTLLTGTKQSVVRCPASRCAYEIINYDHVFLKNDTDRSHFWEKETEEKQEGKGEGACHLCEQDALLCLCVQEPHLTRATWGGRRCDKHTKRAPQLYKKMLSESRNNLTN